MVAVLLVYQCEAPCGFLLRGEDRREIIIAVSHHLKRAHGRQPSMSKIREALREVSPVFPGVHA